LGEPGEMQNFCRWPAAQPSMESVGRATAAPPVRPSSSRLVLAPRTWTRARRYQRRRCVHLIEHALGRQRCALVGEGCARRSRGCSRICTVSRIRGC